MNTAENLRTVGIERELSARHRAADRAALAYSIARKEFLEALEHGPRSVVSMPINEVTALPDVVFEVGDDDVLARMLSIVINTAAQGNAEALGFLASIADDYAENMVRALESEGAFDD